MNKDELQKLKETLLEEKQRIEEALGEFATKDPEAKDDYDSIFPDLDGVSADENAQEVTEFDRRKSLEYNLETRLADINKKLAEIEEGTHGVCHNCEGDINPERLKAVPTANLCINCAKARPL